MEIEEIIGKLNNIFLQYRHIAIAVSGGVDSMILSLLANKSNNANTTIFHSVSPAVPPEATFRVKNYAKEQKWNLEIIESNELKIKKYSSNPINRCFHCKNSLYEAIRNKTQSTILSGTNIDDLNDFRPGLDAANLFGVKHPYVEASINKQMIRNIASQLGYDDLAKLPAGPCLSSRVETGIPISAEKLISIHRIEQFIMNELEPKIVRCRIRKNNIEIELDTDSYNNLSPQKQFNLMLRLKKLIDNKIDSGLIKFSCYKKGSAFIRG